MIAEAAKHVSGTGWALYGYAGLALFVIGVVVVILAIPRLDREVRKPRK